MDKRFLAIILIIVAAFGFLLVNNKKENGTTTQDSTPSNHTTGAGNKKVELIEYGDFQCPVCGAYYPLIEQVRQKYGDDIKFTFKHFPLDSIHQNARAGHRAAEAAGLQGKFWEMYALLYQRQQDWSEQANPIPTLENYAKELGLNFEQYKTDYASSKVNDIINSDVKDGQANKITGTPGILVNGKLMENTRRTVESFSEVIDEAIAEANKDTAGAPTPSVTGAPTEPTNSETSSTPTPEASPAL